MESRRTVADQLASAVDLPTAASVIGVVADAGLGKTWLLDQVRANDSEQVATRWTITARFGERDFSWAALHQLRRNIDPLVDRLRTASADSWRRVVGGEAVGANDRHSVAVALLDAVELAAEHGGVSIIVDDAHWLDGESLVALAFVAARLSRERVTMVFAGRTMPVELDRLLTHRVTLPPLGPAESLAVLEAISPDFSRAVATRLTEACGGNPLALSEIAAQLDAEQRRGERPLPHPLAVGPRLADVYAPTFKALSPPHRAALVVAVLCSGMSRRDLLCALEAIGSPPDALGVLIDTRLVVIDDRVRLRHPLVRDFVLQSSSAAERLRAHHALADTLSDPIAAAMHRAEIAVEGDWLVVKELREAARIASDRCAHAQAAYLLERAADLAASDDRYELLNAARHCRMATGESERATALLTTLRNEATDQSRVVEIEAAMADIDLEVRLATPTARLDHVPAWEKANPDATSRFLSTIAAQSAMSGRLQEAIDVIAKAVELASDESSSIRARIISEMIATVAGTADGIELLRLPWHALVDDDMLASGTIPVSLLVAVQSRIDELEHGVALAERVKAITANRGLIGLVPNTNRATCYCLLRLGRWHEARSLLTQTEELVALVDDSSTRVQGVAMMAWLDAVSGRDPSPVLEGGGVAQSGEFFPSLTGLEAQAIWHLGRAEVDDARQVLATASERCRSAGVTDPYYSSSDCDLAVIEHRAGNHEESRALLDGMWHRLERWPRRSIEAITCRCEGQTAATDAEARQWFARALDLHASQPILFDVARTHLAIGEYLRRQKRPSEARDPLHRATATFEQLGATDWASRAIAELLACGERRLPAGDRRTQLTNQELQVATAVARGATNAEVAAALFLSRRTVEYHLANVYRKLGIHQRGALKGLFGQEPHPTVSTSRPTV